MSDALLDIVRPASSRPPHRRHRQTRELDSDLDQRAVVPARTTTNASRNGGQVHDERRFLAASTSRRVAATTRRAVRHLDTACSPGGSQSVRNDVAVRIAPRATARVTLSIEVPRRRKRFTLTSAQNKSTGTACSRIDVRRGHGIHGHGVDIGIGQTTGCPAPAPNRCCCTRRCQRSPHTGWWASTGLMPRQ